MEEKDQNSIPYQSINDSKEIVLAIADPIGIDKLQIESESSKLDSVKDGSNLFSKLLSSFSRKETDDKLEKQLSGRHIQMIAIGGAIGSGLFVGSGGALAQGGPGNLIFGYIFMSIGIYFTLQALGELAVVFPLKGGFSAYSTRFIHPAWGFAMTWNYVMQWWAVLPLEISAASLTLQFWSSNINLPGFVTLFLVFIAMANVFLGVKWYGESEFFFSFIKAFAVLIFIITAIVINLGGGPNGKYYGGKTWTDPGAFYNGFHGYCGMFVSAAFSFGGTELVGLAACETEQPHKTMPSATKQVVWRIILFYLISLLVIGFIVPYTNPNLLGGSGVNTSPFVIAADLAGITGFADFMNFIVLISTISVGNSSVFGASRTLLAVVNAGQGPKWMGYVDNAGRPMVAILIALSFGIIAYVNTNSTQSVKCFNWLLAISGLSSLFTWGSICLAHIRFRAAWLKSGRTLEEIPFLAQGGVIGSCIGLSVNILALIATFYTSLYPVFGYPAPADDDSTLSAYYFFSYYLAAPVIFASFFFWLIYRRVTYPEGGWGILRIEDIDLKTDIGEFPPVEELRQERAIEASKPFLKRLLNILC